MPGILYKDSEKPSSAQLATDKSISLGESTKAQATIATGSATSSPEDGKETLKDTETTTTSMDIASEMEQIEKEIQELEKQVDSTTLMTEEEPLSASIEEKEPEVVEEDSSSVASSSAASSATSALASANLKALMDAFIAQLPNCVNRELIDKAAKDFCMLLNTKLNRKRLVNALFQVQRTRLDLLPFYARLVATLNPCMPEVSIDLAALLLGDFRFHVRKKDQINIESKVKTARFIGELVKFGMFAKTEALNCLKTLLADFKHHNIEMACNLLDVCGRYLYRHVESHMKLRLLLVGSIFVVFFSASLF